MSTIKEDFDRNFELDKSINKTYRQVMEKVYEIYKPTLNYFQAESSLSRGTYYNIINGYEKPAMNSIVAFAIIFKIDIKNVEDMLRAWGLGFEPGNRVHHAYVQLISKFSGEPLEDCNNYLKEIEIEKKYWLKD